MTSLSRSVQIIPQILRHTLRFRPHNMYTEITSAIQSTKTALELVKAARGLANYSELLTAVTEVQIKLTDAIASELASQEKQAQLAERVRELEKRLSEFESWDVQMQRYALFEFSTKALAYALKPGMENGEPMHYLCLSCVDKRQRSTLQPNGRYLVCPACKSTLATESAPPSGGGRRGGSWMAA